MLQAFGCEGADVVVPLLGQLEFDGQVELFVHEQLGQLLLLSQLLFVVQVLLVGQEPLVSQVQFPQLPLASNTPNPPRSLPSLLSPSGLKSPSKSVFRDFFLSFMTLILIRHNVPLGTFIFTIHFTKGHSSQFPLTGHMPFTGGQLQSPQFPFGFTSPNPPCSFPSLLISRGLNPLFKSVFSSFFFSSITHCFKWLHKTFQ